MIDLKLGSARTKILCLCSAFLLMSMLLCGQDFLFGADQSYVNEMEDCGVVYMENNAPKDVYDIYRDHGSNLVRLRLWHTPDWYDDLNEGLRYSDLADVKKAIRRAKDANMKVLLDFHLSDTWADPGKQFIPEAWLSVVDDLPLLKDSLYNYIYSTLIHLNKEELLPEMVQVGNETNKGILQTEQQNETWKLEWPRNAELFNAGLEAVRDAAREVGKEIKTMIHFAGPEDALWLAQEFHNNGVLDFDIIGLSYYWAWHQPTTIEKTGEIIKELIADYSKEVMIVETGYIWTTSSNDSANNIISDIDPSYGPASPESQKAWLIDLRDEVMKAGGIGMVYWEPSWVSSNCRTLWGQGSHQEHASFFDFDNNLLIPGGIQWMQLESSVTEEAKKMSVVFTYNQVAKSFHIPQNAGLFDFYAVHDSVGILVQEGEILPGQAMIPFSPKNSGLYLLSIFTADRKKKTQAFTIIKQ